MSELPRIDYAAHPAFAGAPRSEKATDERVAAMADRIDAGYARLRDQQSHPRDSGSYETEIAGPMRELCEIVIAANAREPEFAPYVRAAFSKAVGFLYEQLEFNAWRSSQTGSAAEVPAERMERMRTDGFFSFGADAQLAEALWPELEPERQALLRRAAQHPGRHCQLGIHRYSPAARLIKKKLRSSGALALASAYLGCPMELSYASFDYAHPGQTWYRDCYADHGLPTSQTAYMHLDADTEMVKAMLYLRDVGEEQGPFRVVRGSARWRRSPVRVALHKGFDVVDNDLFQLTADGLDYEMGYYRPRYKVPEYRRRLMALPEALRGSTHFGDDILDGSDLSRSLLSGETVFTGPAGTLIVFDGASSIHRGGQVVRGERWAVQIGLRATRRRRRLPRPLEAIAGPIHYHVVKRWSRSR